ncbi:leupaxin-like [Scyliorhinus canicula]|uniref:leupaxin-like n=1 Tax=Scyliorhinus canicula TaxID=7830 RepID=UPI0018F49136|nr:leupaxin-like [Scyliorhinus canicula]
MGTMLRPTSADKQLEDVMTNLAGLLSPSESVKISLDPAPEIASKGAESSLDGMLGTLESDLQSLGVTTHAMGVSSSCKKCIVGTVSPPTVNSGFGMWCLML